MIIFIMVWTLVKWVLWQDETGSVKNEIELLVWNDKKSVATETEWYDWTYLCIMFTSKANTFRKERRWSLKNEIAR